MSVTVGIIIAVAVLFVIAKTIAAGFDAICNSINGMAETMKDASERTEEQLREIHGELYSLHTVVGGNLGPDESYFEKLNGRTIHHILQSIDQHREAMAPEPSKQDAVGPVRLVR